MKEAARLAREKSQDKTELTNPALNITSHQVMLGDGSRGKRPLCSSPLVTSAFHPFLRASLPCTEGGASRFDGIYGPEVTAGAHEAQ